MFLVTDFIVSFCVIRSTVSGGCTQLSKAKVCLGECEGSWCPVIVVTHLFRQPKSLPCGDVSVAIAIRVTPPVKDGRAPATQNVRTKMAVIKWHLFPCAQCMADSQNTNNHTGVALLRMVGNSFGARTPVKPAAAAAVGVAGCALGKSRADRELPVPPVRVLCCVGLQRLWFVLISLKHARRSLSLSLSIFFSLSLVLRLSHS